MTTLTNIYFGGESFKQQFNQLTIKPKNEMETHLKQKYDDLQKLTDLGFTNVEAGDFCYYFDYDDYTYIIQDVYDTINENINYATIISGCCGEEVDSDWMICPCCKEHV
jgi:hypothetical protein